MCLSFPIPEILLLEGGGAGFTVAGRGLVLL